MTNTGGHTLSYEIGKEHYQECLICGKSLKDIKKEIGGENVYFIEAFEKHINQEHDKSLTDYIVNYRGLEPPICPCGICGKTVKATWNGAKLRWAKWACGRNDGQREWSIKAKETRKGAGNPMWGKEGWNKGLTAQTSESMKRIAESCKGRIKSPETREKLRIALAKRTPPHTGHPHSEETKEFLRQNTLRLIREGVFKQTRSKPHIAMGLILDELGIRYEEEKTHGHFNFDYYLVDYNVYIEVDGDYFHSNPKFYPNGPESKTQKINWARDISKNRYCERNELNLIRFWENDIIKNRESVKCTLNELLELNTLV